MVNNVAELLNCDVRELIKAESKAAIINPLTPKIGIII